MYDPSRRASQSPRRPEDCELTAAPERVALVSGTDANYYPLLREWIASVRRCPESAGMEICVIDGGMTEAQLAELRPLATIVAPEWPSPEIGAKAGGRAYLKSCVCRPFIPRIFPGYDIYMWMDSDTWVQDWRGVELFLRAVRERPERLAITNGNDRAYPRQARVKWLWRWPRRVANFYFSNARKPFGFATAKALLSVPVLSACCFAMAADAPHWPQWQRRMVEAATRGKVFTAEQLSLGRIVYLEGLGVELLPAYALWQCEYKPLWSEARGAFVEPFLPRETIGILHMSGVDAMREDRAVREAYATETGGSVSRNIRYPHFDAGRLATGTPTRA